MIVSELLRRQSVLVPLEAADRERAVAALVEALPLPEPAPARAAIRAAVAAREAAGSTGIGNGVAIPHARIPGLPRTIMAAGRLLRPIEFGSSDGKSVSLIFLMAIPAEDPHSYLPVLAGLSRLVSDEKLLRRLLRAAGPDELYDSIAAFPLTEP
jgi:mannitol/fructose-specific phosphotransferase system IIA component (Ntr-type)